MMGKSTETRDVSVFKSPSSALELPTAPHMLHTGAPILGLDWFHTSSVNRNLCTCVWRAV